MDAFVRNRFHAGAPGAILVGVVCVVACSDPSSTTSPPSCCTSGGANPSVADAQASVTDAAAPTSPTPTSAVRKAIAFPGANAGEQIAAAQNDLIQSGVSAGIIDASDYSGLQTIDVPLTLGSGFASSFTLILGRATFVVSKTITVGRHGAIIGAPTGSSPDPTNNASPRTTVFRAADGANLSPGLIQVGSGATGDGTAAVLQDLVIDGNTAKSGTAADGDGVYVNLAGAVDLTRVTVVGAGGNGIRLYSKTNADGTPASNSGIANLTKVFVTSNGGCGLALVNTSDVLVVQSQFERNGLDGVCLTNSGALRITNSDFGGNHRYGLHATAKSAALIVTGNQFGNGHQHDLVITGGWGGNVITGNQFIGSGQRDGNDTYSAISISDTTNSVVTGNFVNMGSATGNRLHSGIALAGGAHAVSGNTISGARGTGGAIALSAGATIATANMDSTTP